MFIAGVKTAWIEALRLVFDKSHPIPEMRGMHVSSEYPETSDEFPGFWVTFVPDPEVRSVGIDHQEIFVHHDGREQIVHRWRGSGTIMITAHAFTALQRDKMIDELIRVIAFGDPEHEPGIARMRTSIEHNDLIGIAAQWDRAVIMGVTESQGTPWGTEEWVAEGTVSVDLNAFFIPDPMPSSGGKTLIPLSAIVVKGSTYDEPLPIFADPLVDDHPADANHGWQ